MASLILHILNLRNAINLQHISLYIIIFIELIAPTRGTLSNRQHPSSLSLKPVWLVYWRLQDLLLSRGI